MLQSVLESADAERTEGGGVWFNTVPVAIGLPTFVVVLVGASIAVVVALRRWIPSDSKQMRDWDRILAYIMATFGVLYGVTLALIAAASYENFRDVEEMVLTEASSVAVLYRDVSGFPQPEREELQQLIVEYVDHVVDVDWPLQRAGQVPSSTVAVVTEIQETLFAFQPGTAAESNLQNNTIGAFNDFMADRGQRIGVTGLELPAILWFVLYSGAMLTAVLIGMIQMGKLRTHLIMAGVLATYVAIVIFAIASFDHAYMGAVFVGPEYFEELQSWLFAATE